MTSYEDGLAKSIVEAEAAVKRGASEAAERALDDGFRLVGAEEDVTKLLAYAKLCHDWGSENWEAGALERCLEMKGLSSEANVRVRSRLLSLLSSFDAGDSAARRVDLATWLLERGGPVVDRLDWTLRRGLASLELARRGAEGRMRDATRDFEAYLSTLGNSAQLPKHWNLITMGALAEVYLAECKLIAGESSVAAQMLERGIEKLEGQGMPAPMTEPAYSLLERALS